MKLKVTARPVYFAIAISEIINNHVIKNDMYHHNNYIFII